MQASPLILSEGASAYLFYGPPGSGKTTAAINALRNSSGRLLIFDMDRKIQSLLNLDPALVKRVDVWQPTGTLSGTALINVARIERRDDKGKAIEGTKGFVPPDPRGYLELVAAMNDVIAKPNSEHTVYVLDSMSTVVEHMMRLILHHHQVSQFTQPLWGVFASNVEEFRAGFLSLPGKRIMIAHTITREDELTKEVRTVPSVPGQSGEKLPKDFNECWFFEGRGSSGKYRILTAASRRYIARTAKGLPVEADLDEAIKVI